LPSISTSSSPPPVSTLQVVASMLDVLHTTDASIGEVIEPAAVEALPLNAHAHRSRAHVPGAHVSHGAQTGDMNPLYWRPASALPSASAATAPNANYFLLDGTSDTDPTFNTLNLSPSPDAVQESRCKPAATPLKWRGRRRPNQYRHPRRHDQFHGTAYEFCATAPWTLTPSAYGRLKFLVQNNFGASLASHRTHQNFFLCQL